MFSVLIVIGQDLRTLTTEPCGLVLIVTGPRLPNVTAQASFSVNDRDWPADCALIVSSQYFRISLTLC